MGGFLRKPEGSKIAVELRNLKEKEKLKVKKGENRRKTEEEQGREEGDVEVKKEGGKGKIRGK